MGRHTTVELRNLIIDHYKKGKSQREIAAIVNKPRTTVANIIKRFKNEGRVINKPKISPKKLFSERQERWIVNQIKINPRLSAPKLRDMVEKHFNISCNAETVRRVLRNNGLNGRIARKKPFVSSKNKKIRLQFAHSYAGKDFSFWKNVLFTDESKFNLFGSDGRVNVWRKPNQEMNPKHLRPTVKHGGGHVMVWGACSAGGVGKLHFVEGNMDKIQYLNILKANLKQSAEKLGIEDSFHFYQDNDPKHTALIVKEWLLYNCPRVIKTPPQSPDLNIIENLWQKLETEIRKHDISSKNDLKMVLLEEWEKISPEYTKTLVESIPNRLKSVIRQKGYRTKY